MEDPQHMPDRALIQILWDEMVRVEGPRIAKAAAPRPGAAGGFAMDAVTVNPDATLKIGDIQVMSREYVISRIGHYRATPSKSE